MKFKQSYIMAVGLLLFVTATTVSAQTRLTQTNMTSNDFFVLKNLQLKWENLTNVPQLGNTTENITDACGSAFNISLLYNDAANEMGLNQTWLLGFLIDRPWLSSKWLNITLPLGEGMSNIKLLYPNDTYGNNLLIQGIGSFAGWVGAAGIISNNMSTSDGDIYFLNSTGGNMAVMYDNGNFSAVGKVCGVDGCIAPDTNASTACAGTTTYLDGEGNCDDVAPVYVDVGGDTMTGALFMDNINITINATYGLCLNIACTRYIYDNGTGVVIQG